jgi:hypothetical protein
MSVRKSVKSHRYYKNYFWQLWANVLRCQMKFGRPRSIITVIYLVRPRGTSVRLRGGSLQRFQERVTIQLLRDFLCSSTSSFTTDVVILRARSERRQIS